MILNKKRLAITLLLFIVGLSIQSGRAGARMPKDSFGQVKTDEEAACKRLAEVRAIPFKGESIDDDAYNTIVSRGKAAIPCLIGKITDITRMKDPRSAPTYSDFRVGDLAFFLLIEITKTPFEQMLPNSVKSRVKDEGVYAYFKYVERLSNRKALQDKWRVWWAKHGN